MPTTPTALTTSHSGITLTFAGSTGMIRKAKDLDVSFSDAVENVSDLTLADGDVEVIEPMPLRGADEIKLEAEYAAGSTYPEVNDEGALTCSLGTITGWAVCVGASVIYQTNEMVALSLTFRVGETPD